MWKRLRILGVLLVWLTLLAAAFLAWHAPVQPATVIADTKAHIPCLFSPDGRWLMSATQSADQLIELSSGWRITLDPHHTWTWPEKPRAAFSRDSQFFMGRMKRDARLWRLNATTTMPMIRGNAEGAEPSIGFSLDSRKVAIVESHHPVEFWDVGAEQDPVTVSTDALFGRRGASWVYRFAWGDGQTFFAEEYRGNRVSCWNVPDARLRFQINHLVESYGINCPTWRLSPDGTRCIAIVTQQPTPPAAVPEGLWVQAWDVPSGKLVWQRPMPSSNAMFDLSFPPDGKQCAICSRDLSRSHLVQLQLWDMESGESRTIAETKGQEHFRFTAGGRFLHHAWGWWEFDGDEARPALAFHDDGYWHDRAGNKHTPYTDEEQTPMPLPGWWGARRAYRYRVGHGDSIAARGVMAGMAADDRWLAVRLTFDYQQGKWVEWVPKGITLPEGLARKGRDYELRLFDVDTGEATPVLHDAQYWLFSPDGKLLVTGGDGNLRVWSLPLTAPVWPRWLIGSLAACLLAMHWRQWRRSRAAKAAVGKATP
jgi:WD40 repeat protein